MRDAIRNFSALQCLMFGIILWAIWRLLLFSKSELYLYVDAKSIYRRERGIPLPNDRFAPGNVIVALKSVLTELKHFVCRVFSLPIIKKNIKNCWTGGRTVDTVTTRRAGLSGNFVLIFDKRRYLFSSQNDPDRLWGLLRLKISGYQWIFPPRVKQPAHEADQSPPSTMKVNPSAWGHLNPSSYCDVGRLFYGVFKLWSKLQRKKWRNNF